MTPCITVSITTLGRMTQSECRLTMGGEMFLPNPTNGLCGAKFLRRAGGQAVASGWTRTPSKPARFDVSWWNAQLLLSLQPLETPGRVTDAVDVDLHAVEHRHPEVIERRVLRIADVAARRERPAAAAREEDRQVVVVMGVAVGVAAAVGDHAVVEQCAVPFGDRPQLL